MVLSSLYNSIIFSYKSSVTKYISDSRKSAYTMYKKFLELRPDYEDVVNMIITPSNKDSEEMQKAIGTKGDKKELERKFKSEEPGEKFKIAIVVDMWLTGFDVPDLDVMYIFKKMKTHNLMQAIARVNRVYKDKKGGLIVDYIGLKGWLLDALKTYTTRDQNKIKDTEDFIFNPDLENEESFDDRAEAYKRCVKFNWNMDAITVKLSYKDAIEYAIDNNLEYPKL